MGVYGRVASGGALHSTLSSIRPIFGRKVKADAPWSHQGGLVYGKYKRPLRAPTKENTLVMIAVDIIGKNIQN